MEWNDPELTSENEIIHGFPPFSFKYSILTRLIFLKPASEIIELTDFLIKILTAYSRLAKIENFQKVKLILISGELYNP